MEPNNEPIQATVATLIESLQKFPPDLPVLVRPKYHGTLDWSDSVPVIIPGIALMEDPDNVTLLV